MKTSKLSQHPEDHSISVLSDSHVKISQLQDNKKESEKELDQDYSTSAFGYLGKFDHSLPSLKTYETFSHYMKGKQCKKSSFKLPNQVMMRNFQLFQQEMWEGVTSAKESLSSVTLATPNTLDHLPPRGYESMLKQTQVHRKGRTRLANLREQLNPKAVKLFKELQALNLPTPTARDWKDSGENMNYKKAAEKKRLAGVLNHTHSDLTGEDTTLNPAFLEEMMGFPVGWTQIGETEKKE